MKITDEMVDVAIAAFDAASSEPRLIECKRCSGKGYHHGFGEHGHDPDWCEDCGGGGFGLADGEERRPIIAALEAALSAPASAKPVDLQMMNAALEAYREGVFLDEGQVHASVKAIVSAALAASPARAAEPRMWFVKDFADGWIAFDNEAAAKREVEHTGAMMLSGYLTPTT